MDCSAVDILIGEALILFDLHCDTLSVLQERGGDLRRNPYHFDLERARTAGLTGQFFALFSQPHLSNQMLRNILGQAERFYCELNANQDGMYLMLHAGDYRNDSGRIAALLHLEGADCLDQDLEGLDLLFDLGLRSLGITWNPNNFLAGGAGAGQADSGLTKLGRDLVGRLDRMPMLLDLSHLSEQSYYEVLELYSKPVLVTHSNAWALCPHNRNLKDRQLKLLSENGGLVGINQVKYFIDHERPDLERVVDHLSYVAEKIGVQHLALGSDFDGSDAVVLSGVEQYPSLIEAMRRRGFSEEEIEMISWRNVLRIIDRVLSD